MIIALLLSQAATTPPTDWSTLAPMPYVAAPQVTPPITRFVADEVAAGRCAMPKPADGHYLLRIDVATLVGPDGAVRRTVPRAIACPTVEQYSAGLVASFARANLQPRTGGGDIWYRATITYDWAG